MDYRIVGTLGHLAGAFPAETLRCARLLIGQGMDAMKVHALMYSHDLQRIIRAALTSGDEPLQKDATTFANELVARGFNQFRSRDVNAPTPASGFLERPDPAYSVIRQIESTGRQRVNSLQVVLRGRITINWQNPCPTPRTGAAGPALNSRVRRVVRSTPSACAGAASSSRSTARRG